MKLFSLRPSAWVIGPLFLAGACFGQSLSLGPVVGGVSDIDAKVFLRTNEPASVQVRYTTDPNFTTYSTSDVFTTDIADDFTKIIPLSGLTAETTYYLDITVNDAPQLSAPYPHFATFPSPGSARNFTFLVMSDFTSTFEITGPTQAFASAAATNPAFVFIGGDFDHRNATTLDGKRKMFRLLYNAATPYMGDFVNLILHNFAIAHQWDDHDTGANNTDKTSPGWDINQQVFNEYVPSYQLPAVLPAAIWQKFSYAQVDFFILDCRSQRDPELDRDDSNKSMLDGNNLGDAGQLEWLKNGLLNSTARWKCIFTSVITNPTTKFPDGWAGYQTEWNALKDFINSNNIQGVFFISGDLHLGAVDDGRTAGFPEMCTSQPNGRGGCPTFYHGVWTKGYYDDPTCKGFNLVTFSTNPDQVTFEVRDEFGNTQINYSFGDALPTPTPTPTPVPPTIAVQPASQTVKVGERPLFTVTAAGSKPYWYQWQKNGADIPAAHKRNYHAPPATQNDNGSLYDVIVTNAAGSVVSDSATLTVTNGLKPGSDGATETDEDEVLPFNWGAWLEQPDEVRSSEVSPLLQR